MGHIDRRDAAAWGFVAGALLVLLVGVPGIVLDGALVVQVAAGAALLAFALGRPRPDVWAHLPSALLVLALSRLLWAVASTRALLGGADAGGLTAALGAATGESWLAGLGVLMALTVMQTMVLTRGAERLAQVAARFALDALPGRQLALEADARAGTLDPIARQARQAALARETAAAGALDGVLRLLRGEPTAGLVLLLLVFGLGLGVDVFERGAPAGEAARRWLETSVGVALGYQIPALLCAAAAAVVSVRPDRAAVTRSPGPVAEVVVGALGLALLTLGALPGHQLLPFAVVTAAVWVALRLGRARRDPVPLARTLHIELDAAAREALADRPWTAWIADVHRALDRRGLPYPAAFEFAVAAADAGGSPGRCTVRLGEAVLSRGHLLAGHKLVTADPGDSGVPDRDPRSGARAVWLAPPPGADRQGLTPGDVFVARLVAVCGAAAGRLLTVDAVAQRLAEMERDSPATVAAAIPRRVDVPGLTRLLAGLMAAGLCPTDWTAVLRALGDLPPGADEAERTRRVRQALAAETSTRFAADGRLPALCLLNDLENTLRTGESLPPDRVIALLDEAEAALRSEPSAAILVAPDVVAGARALLAPTLPGLPVLSVEDLLPDVRVLPVAVLGGR